MKKRLCFLLVMLMLMSFIPMTTTTTTAASAVWDGTVALGFDGGTGTQADPYRISTAEQFARLAHISTSGV